MTRSEVEPIAGGKVWTGAQALERKLVDELGGLDAALRKARSLAGLPDTTPALEVQSPEASARAADARRPLRDWRGYLLEGVTLFNRTPGARADGAFEHKYVKLRAE